MTVAVKRRNGTANLKIMIDEDLKTINVRRMRSKERKGRADQAAKRKYTNRTQRSHSRAEVYYIDVVRTSQQSDTLAELDKEL